MADRGQLLKAATHSYGHKQKVINECENVLTDFKELRPLHKNSTYFHGQTKKLLCLEGTIPIQYKSKTYNIPLAIWMMEAHPYTAPMVFIMPTPTMNIKPGSNVSHDGRVNIPYLKEWRHPSSDLAGLIQLLQITFGESPPVFAKTSRSNQPPGRPANPPYPQPPATQSTPYPAAGMPQASHPAASGPTPYPPASGSGSQYTGYPSASNAQNTSSSSSGLYNPYGPRPPYPNASANFPQPYGQGTGFSYPGSTSSPGYPPAPSSGSNTAYPAATTGSNYSSYPSVPSNFPGSGSGYQNSNTPYPPTTSYNSYSGNTKQPESSQRQSSLSEQEICVSLRSAVSDKMRKKIRELVATQSAEMEALRQTQTDLKAGKDKLDGMMNQMNQEQNECEASISILDSKIEELKEQVSKGTDNKQIKPEDTIDTVAPLYKQLVNSFAEEQAIDDALYLLGKAHAKEIISTEIYLKKVRDLSRRHFMQRATIQKCREKAGLSDIYS